MASKSKPKTSAGGAPAFGQLPSLDDLARMLDQFKLPGVDAGAVLEWQRKDLQALAEANRQAYEGMKALAERRNEILRENLAHWQDSMQEPAGKDALAKQGEAMQRSLKKAMKDFQELAALEAKARTDAWKVVQQRMQDNMASLQQLMQAKK